MKLSYLLTCLSFLMLLSTTEALAVVVVTPKAAVEKTEVNEAAWSKKELRKQERKEKRETRRQFRQQIKEWFKGMRDTMSDSLLLLVIVTILLPPLGMYLYEGAATNRFWISLVLWLLFYVPGLIYTLYVILSEN
ncbi:MAG TPA: YqaE/Pmp3 family membrane protein [Saprospiraceae bacterium]|nr:YqaE/Pmp3 family membrane protein [Saprospiraceae bacterium]